MNTSTRRRLAGSIAASAIVLTAALASAPRPARAEALPEQTGSVFMGAGLGVNFLLSASGSAPNLGFSAGYAFAERVYGVFQPSFSFFSGGTIISLPVGVQYDVPISSVPGLHLYPRASVGPAFFTGGGGAALLLMFDGGIKYNIQDRFYLGFEPFSLPIFIGDGGGATYKVSVFGGLYL